MIGFLLSNYLSCNFLLKVYDKLYAEKKEGLQKFKSLSIYITGKMKKDILIDRFSSDNINLPP